MHSEALKSLVDPYHKIIPIRGLIHSFICVRRQNVVAVEKCAEFARSNAEPRVSRGRHAHMISLDILEPLIALKIFPYDIGGPVSASVVNDDRFEVTKRLREKGIESAPDVGLVVEYGYYYAYFRCLFCHNRIVPR